MTKGKDGRWIATPEFHEQFDSFVNQPTTTTQTPTTQSTQTPNGFKVGDIIEWKENISIYAAKKGDKAKVVGIEPEKEFDLVVEWITPTAQSNGNYYSSMFVKAKNQVLPKSKTPQKSSNSTIIENLEVYNKDFGKMSWYEATQKASELGEGWRLPTIQEYQKILYPNSTKFAFPHESSWSIDENDNDYAWFYNFLTGYGKPQNFKRNLYQVVFVKDILSSTTSTQQSSEEDDEEEPTLVTPEDMDKILEQLRNPKEPPNPFTRVLLIPKKEPKIKEPEPVKRKFKQGANYLKIFTEYFEKDTEMGRPVKSESYTKAIVNNFIIATEDIGGFSKDKLKEIKSYIDKE